MKNKSTENLPICYAIPGLGVTGEVFGRLKEHLSIHVVEWLMPRQSETLEGYALRMAALIPEDAQVLIGYSFGGVVAQEIARQRSGLQLVLINTLVSADEKPLWLQMMAIIPLYRLARGSWRIKLLPLYGRRYGLKSREDISILQKMFSESPDALRMWSIQVLIDWKGGKSVLNKVLRLHGTRDKVFPLARNTTPCRWIEGGRHFMVWQRAKEVGKEISTVIDPLSTC